MDLPTKLPNLVRPMRIAGSLTIGLETRIGKALPRMLDFHSRPIAETG
jgi:hypothetical protein